MLLFKSRPLFPSFLSGDCRRSGGRLVRGLPRDVAGVQDEEKGRGKLHAGGAQTGHRHLPETRQAGGILRITLRDRETHHAEGERTSESGRREKDTLNPLPPLPPYTHLLASPCPSLLSQTRERLSLCGPGTFFSMKTKKKEDKKEKNPNIF